METNHDPNISKDRLNRLYYMDFRVLFGLNTEELKDMLIDAAALLSALHAMAKDGEVDGDTIPRMLMRKTKAEWGAMTNGR